MILHDADWHTDDIGNVAMRSTLASIMEDHVNPVKTFCLEGHAPSWPCLTATMWSRACPAIS